MKIIHMTSVIQIISNQIFGFVDNLAFDKSFNLFIHSADYAALFRPTVLSEDDPISGNISSNPRLKSVPRHPHPAFHQHPRTTAHDDFVDAPVTVVLSSFGADSQGARGVTELYASTFTTARSKIH